MTSFYISLKVLRFEGDALGVRIGNVANAGNVASEYFDVDLETLRQYGIYNVFHLPSEKLIEVGDLLLTQEEVNTYIKVVDLSGQPSQALNDLVNAIKVSREFDAIFKVPAIHELTLQDFLVAGYVPQLVKRSDEYNGQNYLILPDGSKHPRGWIGKGYDPTQVLTRFYHEVLYYGLLHVQSVTMALFQQFEDLKLYDAIVVGLMESIKVIDGRHLGRGNFEIAISVKGVSSVVSVSLDGTSTTSVRGEVMRLKLLSLFDDEHRKHSGYLDSISKYINKNKLSIGVGYHELLRIAVSRRLFAFTNSLVSN